ncbi:nuclear transport factor 2 family protein [Chryseobacterium limigenitum]|uniref:SnoaL-like domain-containing protein n=1 Tax=Chryseobacterium limigenitum TaxID=1612149 RepID=A0A1K2ICI8_9FLAO|nr:nuclear transport factor 2 family protein [Chryseobacterium limigenitum]SFZ90148.1 SnoaL-like domain-containing protein [Chryseobacterium limigenitum]
MTLEIVKIKEELRNLIDDYAYLGDEKKISEVMDLFTPDLSYNVYMNGNLVSNVSGRENMEKDFNAHASQVKTYFTLNGQHTVKINGDAATGISFSQIKMIREVEGKDVLTDYSVKYDDQYLYLNGKWLIKERIAYFIILESRSIS